MTKEVVKQQKPYITIDGVQLTVDELPDADSKRWFSQLQQLIQEKTERAFALERTNVGIDGFIFKIVTRYNENKEPTPVNGEDESTLESDNSK